MITLTTGHLRAGVWEAVLTSADAPPEVEVLQNGAPMPGASLVALAGRPGQWLLRQPVAVERLNDGVQTYLIRPVGSAETLGQFSIVAGVALEADLRAEIDLLRAELDLMKRVFRRHMAGAGA